ncbi:chitinase-like protein 4 [Phalaenopsis equestris]|uniref:chitinase-like protein 4 n=1 Tax=Phalaenopsis equestris TaxID=78828 RepID=UPI0009E3FDCF|nr:chitinase-like protein 4 [Phalaenopsis equestris]
MHYFGLIIFLSAAVSFCHFSAPLLGAMAATHEVRAGYWLSSAGHYSPLTSIDVSLYTHLYYYSISLDPDDSSITLPPPEQLPLLLTFSTTLKTLNSSLKTLLSLATDGHQANEQNTAFSDMAADPVRRAVFINSTVELAKMYSFDGLDLAWEFPSSSSDMDNLGVLLEEWRASISNEAGNSKPPLLLTATVYFSDHLFDGQETNLDYPINAISSNLDWINVLCFGYHKNSKVAAADAALIDKTSHFSASYSISSWIDSGISSGKLVMGIPLYGRSWYLKNKEKNGLGAQVVATGPRQRMSNQSGVMAYFEIENILKEAGSTLVYDNNTLSTYFHNGGLWVSFDSLEVMEQKIKFARQKDLLGYFLYPVSFDNSNHTISKQALDAWERYHSVESNGEGDPYGEAPTPEGTPGLDQASNQSADLSNSLTCFRRTMSFLLPLFLLLYFALLVL